MARTIYACRFEPTSLSPAAILARYREWIESHYHQRRGIASFRWDEGSGAIEGVPSEHSLIFERLEGDEGSVRRIVWTFPAENDEGLIWRNEVRIGEFQSEAVVEHLISVDSVHYRLAPPNIAFGSPGVIRQLCAEAAVKIGDMQLRATPYALDVNRVDEFLDLLESPLRLLPIVFITPYASGVANGLDPYTLSECLAGVAVVIDVRDAEATWDIAHEIGRSLACFNGGVRIYWPGFSRTDDRSHHPLYLGDHIESLGPFRISRSIQSTVFAVSAFRFVSDHRVSSVLRSVEERDRRARFEERKGTGDLDWAQFAEELDKELQSAKSQISELQAENDNLRANQQLFFNETTANEGQDGTQSQMGDPRTVAEAVAIAQKRFQNIEILDSAVKAAGNSPFQRPADVLGALVDLDAIAAALKAGTSAAGIQQALSEKGWGKRCAIRVSQTTRTRYKDDYTFEYSGKKQLFEPHITIGSGQANSCASIHFIWDGQKKKIIIAHVGRHLPNTSA